VVLTAARDGIVRLETFLTVMLYAKMRLGNVRFKLGPLALMVRAEVILATCVLIVLKYALLVISRLPTVFKLMPSSVVRAVSVMNTLLAWEIPVVNVSCWIALRVVHWIAPTEDKTGN